MKYQFQLIILASTRSTYFAWPHKDCKSYDWSQSLWWEKDGNVDSPYSDCNLELCEKIYGHV